MIIVGSEVFGLSKNSKLFSRQCNRDGSINQVRDFDEFFFFAKTRFRGNGNLASIDMGCTQTGKASFPTHGDDSDRGLKIKTTRLEEKIKRANNS